MIVINDLTKKYAKNTVIEKLNLTIENGQVYCLLGKNGAGKIIRSPCSLRTQ
jgi:ABC-2 type transport system ATP-binding protein